MTVYTSYVNRDNLTGSSGDDQFRLYGLLGGTINGGAGYDTLDFSAYPRGLFDANSGSANFVSIENVLGTVNGTTGDDVVSFASLTGTVAGSLTINGGAGNDSITGGNEVDYIHGNSGTNTLSGGGGSDYLYSDSDGVRDNLYGGAGDDKLYVYGVLGGTIDGGDGSDLLDFSAYPRGYFDANSGTARFLNIEAVAGTVNGSSGNDVVSFATLTGTVTGTLTINGGAGSDTITGGNEVDYIHGNSGTNTLSGGGGSDYLYSDSDGVRDNLNGGAGDDRLFVYGVLGGTIDGGDGSDLLDFSAYPRGYFDANSGTARFLNIEAVAGTVNGSAGNDVVSFATLTGTVTGTLTINGGAGSDTITGGNEVDYIHGNSGTNTLSGGGGSDYLYSDSDGVRDNLYGGAGDDTLLVYGVLGGTIDGGAGIDTLDFSSYPRGSFDANSGIAKFLNIEKVIGTINGSSGNDILSLVTLTKATGSLTINGYDGNDRITGGSEVDTIYGGNGDDRLDGGAGADYLKGDAGRDTFVFKAAAQTSTASPDHIVDFVSGTDKIDLSGIDANSLIAGNQAFVLGSGAFTGLGQLRITTEASHVVLIGNSTGDLAPDFKIILDTGVLNAPDIIY